MDHYVITIARGFGSGGKQIGIKLAEDLGINCYENRILSLASMESGYDESLFEDEKLNGNALTNALAKIPRSLTPRPVITKFASNPELFEYQKKIIKKLAETESCVIVGKCADYILKDYPNVVSVYIEAPREYCLRRITTKMMISDRKANELITKTDKYRADYYKHYTGGNYWTNPINYDLTLNSARLGTANCVQIIKDCLKLKLDSQTSH